MNTDNYDAFLVNKVETLKSIITKYKVPILSSLIVACLCYMFAFTNKLINHDEMNYLFDKGATISSGRWGLELTSAIFPDFSMPWLYGLISVALITVGICLIINIFSVNHKFFQALISGLIMSFPSLIGLMAYMFTSASFALSFLLSIATVYLLTTDKKINILYAMIILIFSISIYQAYVAVTASLLVTYLLQKLLVSNESVAAVFKKAFFFLSVLAVALAVYYGITLLVMKITGITFNEYAAENLSQATSVLSRVFQAYLNFFGIFAGRFNLVIKPVFQAIHILLVLASGGVFLSLILKRKDINRTLFSCLLMLLLPLSICCMYLFVDGGSIHSLMVYSFVSVYLFMIVIIQSINDKEKVKKIFFSSFSCLFAVIVLCNVYTANKSYLQLHLAYENVYSYYSSVMTSVFNTPGFSSESKIVFYTDDEQAITQKFDHTETFGDDSVMGIFHDLINSYSKERFVNYFLGYDVDFATEDEIKIIEKSEEFKKMQIYPYYGSVKKIGDYIVVRLS